MKSRPQKNKKTKKHTKNPQKIPPQNKTPRSKNNSKEPNGCYILDLQFSCFAHCHLVLHKDFLKMFFKKIILIAVY